LNPLGGRYQAEELTAIVELARRTRSLIVHDCTYRHFADGHLLAATLYPEGTFTTYRFSKWLGLAGLRLGAVVAAPELLARLAGPITRSVADAATVFGLVRGPDPRDPQSYWSRPPASFVARPRVGVVRAPFGIDPADAVASVVGEALELLEPIADLRETTLPAALPREVFETLWVTGRGLGFRDLVSKHADEMDPGLVRLASLAQEYSLADYYAALTKRREFNAAISGCFTYWSCRRCRSPRSPPTPKCRRAERRTRRCRGSRGPHTRTRSTAANPRSPSRVGSVPGNPRPACRSWARGRVTTRSSRWPPAASRRWRRPTRRRSRHGGKN
jgi:hypothetical protein